MLKGCLMFIGLLSIYYLTIVECKSSRKVIAVKKASSLKPTKLPKNIVDVFKGLPTDDIEFIKQLDKQFEKFGNNVKIKIQKENRTITSKNSKRTIDGSLGYGYYGNQNEHQQNNYYFSKPRFQIYPYSQHDIPPTPQYQQQQQFVRSHHPQAFIDSTPNQEYYSQPHAHTSVEIQPSRSYEIKQTETGYKTIFNGEELEHQNTADYHHSSQPVHQEQTVPVIVLRIPGPQKYASHLQALLQQYLEVRAAQYIQALQEQEAQQDAQAQIGGVADHHEIQYNEHESGSYQPTDPYHEQHNVEPQAYIAPVDIQQGYNEQHQSDYQSDYHPHPQTADELIHNIESHTESNIYYQSEHADQISTQHHTAAHHGSYEYQNIHPEDYNSAHHDSIGDHDHLQTTENFPSDSHTQVIFKSTTQHPYHYHSSHSTAPVHVQTYRAPLVYHKLEQFYGNQHKYDDDSHSHHNYDDGHSVDTSLVNHSPSTGANFVTITQRPVLPYNYHAHHSHSPQTYHAHYSDDNEYSTVPTNTLFKRNSAKRHATQQPQDRYKKFTNLMHRMKARITSTKLPNGGQVK